VKEIVMIDATKTGGGEPPAEIENVPATPFCGELRSKKFFMLDVLPTEAEQYLDDSAYCWCFRTQQAIGPDGMQASPTGCVPGRACYISGLTAGA
jgi:hypothetical protein